MEIQQINNEFNPPHLVHSQNEYGFGQKDKQHTQLNGKKRLKELAKHYCTNFPPYQTYFNNKQYHLTLYKSKPKPCFHTTLYDRQRLSLERQAMYYRGGVDTFLTDDILKECIEDNEKDRGFVEKRGNKCLIHDRVLYYANESTIKAIQMPRLSHQNTLEIYQQSVQPIQIVSFQHGNVILQLQALQNHYLNNKHEGVIIKIRFIRRIVLYSVKQRKVLTSLQSPSELIQLTHSIYSKHQLQTVEYDGVYSSISTYHIQHNKQQRLQMNLKQSFKLQHLVNTKIDLNRNEFLLTKYHGLFSFDRRTGKQTQLYQVNSLSKQRIYSSIPLKGTYHFSPLIANCHSRYISIFDIRKPNQLIKTYPHQSQQSPPQIMNFYDGNSLSNLFQPIITCHSPYSLGSSTFFSINLDNFQELNTGERSQLQYYKTPQADSHFTLLYDKAKSSGESALHRFYNGSISVWNSSPDQFSVIQVDNQGSVGIQMFKYQQMNQQYRRRELHTSNPTLLALNTKEQNPSETWLQQNIINKYFLKQTIYEQIEVEVETQIVVTKNKKKSSKKKKTKTKQKSQKKITQLKEPQTEVDMQDFLEGQYQNSSECQKSPSKKKVNFANLTQFYSILQQKATFPKVPIEKKSNQLDFSLNSTQPNSQGLNFSQSVQIESGIKALSFHNKKLMNYSILEKLKNEWDN